MNVFFFNQAEQIGTTKPDRWPTTYMPRSGATASVTGEVWLRLAHGVDGLLQVRALLTETLHQRLHLVELALHLHATLHALRRLRNVHNE